MTWAGEDHTLEDYAGLALCHTATVRSLHDLAEHRRKTPWWAGLTRWRLAVALREARGEQDDQVARLESDPRSRDLLLHQAIDTSVHRLRQPASFRNAYHREVLEQLDDLAARVLERIADDQYWIPRRYGLRLPTVPMTQVRAFDDLLTPEQIAAAIRCRIEHLAAVADDDEMLEDTDGETYAVVQHRASGLRASFTVNEDAARWSTSAVGRFGTVFSKPYRIASLSPDPDPGPWEWYVGLGIGTKIYRRGALLLPDVRWISSVTAAAASGARRHLHQEDPYAWRWSDCAHCRGEGFGDGWSDTDRARLESLHR